MSFRKESNSASNLVKSDYKYLSSGFEDILKKLEKFSKTLNPQEPGKKRLDFEIRSLKDMKYDMEKSFKSILNMDL